APLDSFRVVIKARIPNITITDFSGKVVYNGSIPKTTDYVYAIIDLQNLEDPLFSAMTGGRYYRSIKACSYPYPELIEKPLKVLDGNGSSDETRVIGLFSREVSPDRIYFGDFYPRDGAHAYVILNGSLTETTAPIIVNTTINGIPISPTRIFEEGDRGVLVFGNVSGGVQGWCALDYGYRVNVTITNSGSTTLTNFQIPIELDLSSNKISLPQTPKIIIYDENCNPINFWVEEWEFSSQGANENINALIWVNVTISANSEKTLGIYFDENAIKNRGNASKVFEFYDNFEAWEEWQEYGNGVVSQSNEVAYNGSYSLKKDQRNDPNGGYKLIGKTIERPILVEGYIYRLSSWNGGPSDRVGLEDGDFNGYSITINHNKDFIRLDKRTSGSATSISNESSWDPAENSWYFFRMIIGEQEIALEVYDASDPDRYNIGTTTESVSVLDTTYSQFDRVVVHGGYEYYVDSLRIRKYVDPMPTVTASTTIESKSQQSGSSLQVVNARAYDLTPFLQCISEQEGDIRYFGIYNAPSFFERLEGNMTNHEAYFNLSKQIQDELGTKYGNQYYPIGLVSFMIPSQEYDNKLFDLFNTLNMGIEEGQSSVDYYFLQYYFGNGTKVNAYRVWGISYGILFPNDLSTVPFFLDNETAVAIFGGWGAQDLLVSG
ncbi:MAG TPA: DUF2341 domain-containing protein, partial [candidate division WOR-3 bacterium]|nr:DUF2341 domain-containing protein [candidate division WOR-3 bacterium]